MAANLLETLIQEIAMALQPLGEGVTTPEDERLLLGALGWDLPASVADVGLSSLDVSALSDRLQGIVNATPDERADELLMAGRYAELLVAIGDLVQAIATLVDSLAAPGVLPGGYLAATRLHEQLFTRLLDYLVIRHVETSHDYAFPLLQLAGVFEKRSYPADTAAYQIEHERYIVHVDPLVALFSLDRSWGEAAYGWGSPGWQPDRLLANLALLLQSLGGVARTRLLPRAVEERLLGRPLPEADAAPLPQLSVSVIKGLGHDPLDVGLALLALRPQLPDGTDGGLALAPYARGSAQVSFPLTGDARWSFEIESTADLQSGPLLVLRPRQPARAVVGLRGGDMGSPIGTGHVAAGLRLRAAPGGWIDLLALPGGSAVQLREGYVLGGVESATARQLSPFVEVGLAGGRLTLDLEGLDPFLARLLPAGPLVFEFDVAIAWSADQGLHLSGSGGLETTLPLHVEVGPLRLDRLHLVLRLVNGVLGLEVGVSGGAQLGPLTVAVERVGLGGELAFQRGNLGPVDLRLGLRDPSGLGIAIDAGAITGSGFLRFDRTNGRYAGLLQLDLYGIAVTAIGLLDTRGTGGAPLPPPGYSFLIVVAVELPPIQLGFGFVLVGVGGLLGIHRTLVTEALQSGLRDGSIDHVMFPEDPLRTAPQIISDLRALFPPQEGRYVFGPMALLGWGTPALIEAEIGLILELPEPVVLALLGQLSVALPTKDVAIVALHVDVLGILDFNKKQLSIDASLRDSYVAALSVYGDLALRLGWGDEPNFALSIGGLNPHFQPPPGFPALRRVTVSLGLGDNPRISLQGYLAVTSNSLQFGALAELYAAAGPLSVYGWMSFDALIVFSPFYFRFDFSVGFALRWDDDAFAGIAVSGTLAGPAPFHVRGEGCISILFFDICIGFDVTFGERRRVELPTRDPWPLLEAAIVDPRNWSALLPGATLSVVVLRPAAGDTAELLLHPMGSATLRQRVLPLNRTIDRFGEFALVGGTQRFELRGVHVGDDPAGSWSTVDEFFAPGQFETLSDAAKLSRPSFEKMVAGVSVGSQRVEHGPARARRLAYETRIVDSPWDSRAGVEYAPSLGHQLAMSLRGAKAQSRLRGSGTLTYAPAPGAPGFALEEELYAVADTASLTAERRFGMALRAAEAHQTLDAHLTEHPEDRGRLQVVPLHELEEF